MVLLPPCLPQNCNLDSSGKDFRFSLRKPSPNYPHGQKARKTRVVPAFTIQALQKNTRVVGPKKCGIYDPLPQKRTMFRRSYERGEIPISVEYTNGGRVLRWKVPVEKLDFHHYLPIFFDGMAEKGYPYSFIIRHGIKDLVTKGCYKILPVVPQLIIPLKNALQTKRPDVIYHALECIQIMVSGCDRVGEALVPYYRQILPVVNLFKTRTRNVCQGANSDLTVSREENLAEKIEDTLQTLERYGGPDAFINIKYMVPTYESCVLN